MERLTQRLNQARQALTSLQELTGLERPTLVERDAAIQRFEYTVEALWKTAQLTLSRRYGVELASPKPVVRACAQNGLLDEVDARAAMAMIDDRNLTAHTYNAPLAASIHGRLASHAELLERWLTALEKGPE
ncbi:MAG: nucleotidyltransferase [Alphaproteobacteria bacterium CG_4_10_14_0_2_um_filter_63_37]|nr:MAG: nucleotidyltransferase [Proteobacteria bacterium CG1_02_64_396]PJA25534.1 MAG: nucleotidyltransferase [Alphaproteobacteria bacterium CG_4_10_14_0_2_um_filter_63_37]